jgi:hypothetical protein
VLISFRVAVLKFLLQVSVTPTQYGRISYFTDGYLKPSGEEDQDACNLTTHIWETCVVNYLNINFIFGTVALTNSMEHSPS